MVRRYQITKDMKPGQIKMTEHPTGNYVRFEDYEKLFKKHFNLLQTVREIAIEAKVAEKQGICKDSEY